MRKVFTCLLFLSITGASAQIRFDKKPNDPLLFRRALRADSAINKGEFGEIHSLLIIKDGRLLFEKYYNNWNGDSLHQLQSATKSVIATLLGCAMEAGFIPDTEEPVYRYYPSLSFADSLKRKIKIHDLLTQQHGLQWQEGAWEDPRNSWRTLISRPGNWYERILDTPMDTLPGTKFNYSNAAPTLITGIIQNASNRSIEEFAESYLFGKMGIRQYRFWQGNGGPRNNGMALLSLRTRDMAKIGQLYLQDGLWNKHRLLPLDFVRKATAPIVTGVGMNGAYKQYDYGYFWWCNPVSQNDKRSDVFLARGAGGQNIIVNRKEKLVVVITAWNMQQPSKPQLIYEWYLAG